MRPQLAGLAHNAAIETIEAEVRVPLVHAKNCFEPCGSRVRLAGGGRPDVNRRLRRRLIISGVHNSP